jgi:hypothetical protein
MDKNSIDRDFGKAIRKNKEKRKGEQVRNIVDKLEKCKK